jgi:hypothetical protein
MFAREAPNLEEVGEVGIKAEADFKLNGHAAVVSDCKFFKQRAIQH